MNVVLASQAGRQATTTYDTGPHVQNRSRHDYVIPTSTGSRIRLNVRGLRFETYEQTLDQFPHTLLGSASKRLTFYDSSKDEYIIDRDRGAFDSILFFYQSGGILSRPDDIPEEMFIDELKFFGITKKIEEPKSPGVVEKTVPLPNHPIQRKIWQILEYPESSFFAALFGKFSLLVIVLSLFTFCVETIPEYRSRDIVICDQGNNGTSTNHTITPPSCKTIRYGEFWFTVEIVYVSWFSFELFLRLCFAPDKLRFIISPLGIVDIVAILPFYFTLMLRSNIMDVTSFPVLRILRLFRVIRILKLGRYSTGIQMLAKTLKSFSKEIPSLSAMILVSLTLFSSIMYYAEKDVTDSDFDSIPGTFWWGIITMTSVGYGDQVPKGVIGKFVGAFCALIGGILIMAFPSPILISSFEEVYEEKEQAKHKKETSSKNKVNVSNDLSEIGSTVGEVPGDSSGTGSDASDTALLSSKWKAILHRNKEEKITSFSNKTNIESESSPEKMETKLEQHASSNARGNQEMTQSLRFLPPLVHHREGNITENNFVQLDIENSSELPFYLPSPHSSPCRHIQK